MCYFLNSSTYKLVFSLKKSNFFNIRSRYYNRIFIIVCLVVWFTEMSTSVISVLSKTTNIFKELQKALPNIIFHQVQEAETDEQFRKSHIIIGDYDLLGPHIYNLPNTKLAQGTWAGIDALLPYIRSNEAPPFPIVRFSGQHFGRLIGEYVVATIINFERNIHQIKENQHKQKWITEGNISHYRSIHDLTIGILGTGNIGDKIARLLKYMGATILGFGRRESINLSTNDHINEYYNKNNLHELLQNSDYVVNVLPNTSETRDLLDGRILENCKDRGTVFVNVGRGSIISEECLVRALQEKWIVGAILDVFDFEPLRTDSPLWKMQNVFISPHVSGVSRAKDIAEQFTDNLKLYEHNLPIPATIDFAKGY